MVLLCKHVKPCNEAAHIVMATSSQYTLEDDIPDDDTDPREGKELVRMVKNDPKTDPPPFR